MASVIFQAGINEIPLAAAFQCFVASSDAMERTVLLCGYDWLTWDDRGSMFHSGIYRVASW